MNNDPRNSQIHSAVDDYFADMNDRPSLQNKVLAQTRGEVKVKKRLSVGLVLLIVLMLIVAGAFAWTLSRTYFEDVAKMTFENGEHYLAWSLEEKRAIIRLMQEHGLVDDETADALAVGTHEAIDQHMLARYGVEDMPGDMSMISLTRILWVELGPYTHWTNETWVWYTDMMFEIGLLTEHNDVDVYETPGDEAITPEEAMEIAKQSLLSKGTLTEEQLSQATVLWHYMTHASDVNREKLQYWITYYVDHQSYYTAMWPDGTLLE